MQIFTIKLGESLRIGDDVKFTPLSAKGRAVKTGTDAPRDVRVVRRELLDKLNLEMRRHDGRAHLEYPEINQ